MKDSISQEKLTELLATVNRFRAALVKIANRYPCETADAMSRLAKETIGTE